MKRFTGVILCLILVLSIAGCAQVENEAETQGISVEQTEAVCEVAASEQAENTDYEVSDESSEPVEVKVETEVEGSAEDGFSTEESQSSEPAPMAAHQKAAVPIEERWTRSSAWPKTMCPKFLNGCNNIQKSYLTEFSRRVHLSRKQSASLCGVACNCRLTRIRNRIKMHLSDFGYSVLGRL